MKPIVILEKIKNLKTYTLYHCADKKVSVFDDEHFGKYSLGGLTFGDAIYFCDSIEKCKSYCGTRNPYILKCVVECDKVISAKEYNKLLNELDKENDYDGSVWNTHNRRNIMLNNNIDAVDDLPSEFAVFNLNCITVKDCVYDYNSLGGNNETN